MKPPSRSTSIAIASLVALFAARVRATAAPCEPTFSEGECKCAAEIVKDAGNYSKARIKLLKKCNDDQIKASNALNAPGDDIGACDVDGKIEGVGGAAEKLHTKINGKCLDEGIAPADVGWPGTCPDFENGGCTNTITTSDDIATCLKCMTDAAVGQAINLLYFNLSDSSADPDLRTCQRTVGKETVKFFLAKEKALDKCRKKVDNGDLPGPCPDGPAIDPLDPTKFAKTALGAIGKAESKKVTKICKDCGDTTTLDGATCQANGPGAFTPTQIGITTCPAVTVPGQVCQGGSNQGASCTAPSECPGGICQVLSCSDFNPINDITELAKCVDCAAEYKADCLDLGSSRHQVGTYPNECGGAPSGPCPTTVQLDTDGAGTDFDLGLAGIAHDNHAPSMQRLTLGLSCPGSNHPTCGSCTVSGPIANGGGTAFNNHRCTGGTWVTCNTNADCAIPGGTCEFFLGAPQPIVGGGISTCLTNQIAGGVSGSTDPDAGTSSTAVNLIMRMYSGLALAEGCPNCVSGTCDSGARAGFGCTINGPTAQFGDTSFDCPPTTGGLVGTLPIALNLATGTQTRTLSAASPNCRAGGHTGEKCFCDTCNNASQEPCSSDADCPDPPGPIGPVCGGLRCLGGSNGGAACTVASECPGGTCSRPGLATQPNACNGGTCSPNAPDSDSCDEGVCAGGPSENFCGPTETFRPCIGDSDCPAAGDTCSITTLRECFTDNGVVGGDVQACGQADPPTGNVAQPTVASSFCIGPAGSAFVNAAGLPGLSRVTIPLTATYN